MILTAPMEHHRQCRLEPHPLRAQAVIVQDRFQLGDDLSDLVAELPMTLVRSWSERMP